MAEAKMKSEQGMVQLGLAIERGGIFASAPSSLVFRVPMSSGCLHTVPSEVYVIGKPFCPV